MVPGAQEVDVEAPLAGQLLYLQGKSCYSQAACSAEVHRWLALMPFPKAARCC